MDLGFETRYEELFRCLKSAGVKDETLNALVEDEGSWEQAIKNRFKNKRKNKPQGVKRLPAQHTEALKPKKVKTMDVGKIPEIAEGETVETCREHALAMKKELSKTSNRNIIMVRQLMEITFPVRRAKILTESMSVEDVLKEYPGLQLVSEFKFEFGRILCDKNLFKTMADNFKGVLKPKILKLAKTKMSSNTSFVEMEEALADNIDKKSEIEGATAIILLPKLMSSKGIGELLKMCLDDDSVDAIIEDTVAPKLIGGGHVGDIVPLYLAAEGKVVLKLNSGMPVSQALVLLIASYYIFNIEYASNLKNVFLALEATIMDRMEEANKRVSVNKFLQELN